MYGWVLFLLLFWEIHYLCPGKFFFYESLRNYTCLILCYAIWNFIKYHTRQQNNRNIVIFVFHSLRKWTFLKFCVSCSSKSHCFSKLSSLVISRKKNILCYLFCLLIWCITFNCIFYVTLLGTVCGISMNTNDNKTMEQK